MSNLTFSVENNVAEIVVVAQPLWQICYLCLDKDDNIVFANGSNDSYYSEPLYYIINKLEHFIDCVKSGINNVSFTIDGYELFSYKKNKIIVLPGSNKFNKFIFDESDIDLFNKICNKLTSLLNWLKTL
jgi:hypothetical protein